MENKRLSKFQFYVLVSRAVDIALVQEGFELTLRKLVDIEEVAEKHFNDMVEFNTYDDVIKSFDRATTECIDIIKEKFDIKEQYTFRYFVMKSENLYDLPVDLYPIVYELYARKSETTTFRNFLSHYLSKELDMNHEFFSKDFSGSTVHEFYKDLKNFIELEGAK